MNNNFNSISSGSMNVINTLVEKINSTCDALIMALEINSESISDYNMTIVNRMNMNSEFIDRVVSNIIAIKKHLLDLQKGINENLIHDTGDLQTIVSGLKETSDKLNELLLSDNNFNNIYSMPIVEIQTSIDKLLDEIKIGEIILR